MPRAGRPVNRLVSAVSLAGALSRAWRCAGETLASGQNRYAVPICTAEAPKASAANRPRWSAMPPAAITGTLTASATCGTRAKVPIWLVISSLRNMPRWPPAS
ncbi:hypothetical protein D3C71_1545890 [compost metagenome]